MSTLFNGILFSVKHLINEIYVPRWFFLTFFFISAIIFILTPLDFFAPISKWMIKFHLPYNYYLSLFFNIFDPLLILAFMGIYTFSKYYLIINPDSDIRFKNPNYKNIIRRFSITILLFLISLFFITFIENYLLKPTMNIDRPVTRLEHSICSEVIKSGLTNYPRMSELFDVDFECELCNVTFSYLKYNLDVKSVSDVDLISFMNIDNLSVTNFQEHIQTIRLGKSNYRRDIDLNKCIDLLIYLHTQNVYKENTWLLSLVSENYSICEEGTSCPSGFLMRQLFVWFFALLLIIQPNHIKNKLFLNNNSVKLYLWSNSIFVIIIGLSRIYYYRHTLYDLYLTFTLTIVLSILLLLVFYYNRGRLLTIYYDEVEDMFYKTDNNDIIIECNNSFCNKFGFNSKAQAIGVNIKELWVYPKLRDQLKNDMDNNKGLVSDYLVYAKKYGDDITTNYFIISVTCNYYYYDSNKNLLAGIEGTIREVSDIIEFMPDAFYRTNKNEEITYCNNSFCRLFNKSRNDLMYSNIRTLWKYPWQRIIFLQTLKKRSNISIIIDAKRFIKEGAHYGHNYEDIFVEVDSRLVDSLMPEKGVEGSLREVTFLKILFKYSFHGIYVIQEDDNGEYKFSYVNDKLIEMFGYKDIDTPTFLADILVRNIVAKESWDIVKEQIYIKIKNEKRKLKSMYSFFGVTKEGKKFPVQVSSSHYPSYKGKPAVLGYIRDITIDEEEKSRVGYSFMNQITRAICHEILNPISGVKSFLQQFIEDRKKGKKWSTKKIDDTFLMCLENIQYTFDSTKFLKDFYEIANQPTKSVNLFKTIDELCHLINRKISIKINVNKSFNIKGHETGLTVVLLNILKNSEEAMPDGGSIYIDAETFNSSCRLIIKDEGTGIPNDIMRLLFKPFVTTKDKKKNRGLGLHIAQMIVHSWDGTIRIDKSNNSGTTIVIIFSLAE